MDVRTKKAGVAPRHASNQGRWRSGALLVLALATFGTAAHAKDLCLTYSGGGTIVAKRFKAPRANRCVAVQGFERRANGAVVTGTACTSANGSTLQLSYSGHDWAGASSYFETATCHIGLPVTVPQAATCTGTFISTPGGSGRFNQTTAVEPCDANVPD